jgi:hypothetical protein
MSNKTLSGAGPAVPPVGLADWRAVEDRLDELFAGLDALAHGHFCGIAGCERDARTMQVRAVQGGIADLMRRLPQAPPAAPPHCGFCHVTGIAAGVRSHVHHPTCAYYGPPAPAQPLSPPAGQGRQEEQLSGKGVEAGLVAENTRLRGEVERLTAAIVETRDVLAGFGDDAELRRQVSPLTSSVWKARHGVEWLNRVLAGASPAPATPLPDKQQSPLADPEGAMRVAAEQQDMDGLSRVLQTGERKPVLDPDCDCDCSVRGQGQETACGFTTSPPDGSLCDCACHTPSQPLPAEQLSTKGSAGASGDLSGHADIEPSPEPNRNEMLPRIATCEARLLAAPAAPAESETGWAIYNALFEVKEFLKATAGHWAAPHPTLCWCTEGGECPAVAIRAEAKALLPKAQAALDAGVGG